MTDPKVYVDITCSSIRAMQCDVFFECSAALTGNTIVRWFVGQRVL